MLPISSRGNSTDALLINKLPILVFLPINHVFQNVRFLRLQTFNTFNLISFTKTGVQLQRIITSNLILHGGIYVG